MLSEHFTSAQQWFAFLAHNCTNTDGSWKTGIWITDPLIPKVSDWQEGDMFAYPAPTATPSDWGITPPGNPPFASTGYKTWGTVWSAYSADTLGAMSQTLQNQALSGGDTADATTYSNNYRYYTNIAASIRKAYTNDLVQYDGSGNITYFKSYGTYDWPSVSQGDCLTALHFSMIPDVSRSHVITNILVSGTYGISNYNLYCSDISKCSNHISTGYYFGSREMLELTRDGFTTNAYYVLTRAEFPSWLYQVTNGATTCWESWNSYVSGPNTPNSNNRGFRTGFSSFSHLPIGSVGEWIWKTIGGLNPDDNNPGFKNIVVKPEPGGNITNAWASFNSIHGPVICTWTNNSGSSTYNLTLTMPANVTATVYIPTTNFASITENAIAPGQPASNAVGVLSFYTTNYPNFRNGATVLQVGSGTYQFKATSVTF